MGPENSNQLLEQYINRLLNQGNPGSGELTAGDKEQSLNRGGFPYAATGSLLAGPFLQKLGLFGKEPQWQGVDPEQFKDQLVLSDSDIARIRRSIFGDTLGAQAGAIQNIKQVGAARRLPPGATQENIAKIMPGVAKAISGVEPQLQERKRQSMMDYLRFKTAYDQAKTAFDAANTNRRQSFFEGTIGGLAKILSLWEGGLFNKPDALALAMGGNNAS